MVAHREGESGALHVPMLLVFLVSSIAGFGFWGLLRQWRFQAETQLRLDRCVGEAALELKRALDAVDRADRAIRGIRVVLAGAAALAPQAVQALKAGLEVEVARQELWLGKWKAKQVSWALQAGCGRRGDLAPPLPRLGYRRGPPDLLGPVPLSWPERPRELRVRAFHFPRRAAARVMLTEGGTRGWAGWGKNERWSAEWADFP